MYALVKRRAVGDKRPPALEEFLRIQRVSHEEREEFISSLKRKCEERGWLTFYTGGDGREYVYINVEAWKVMQMYLESSEP